jgi:hypothetical protein
MTKPDHLSLISLLLIIQAVIVGCSDKPQSTEQLRPTPLPALPEELPTLSSIPVKQETYRFDHTTDFETIQQSVPTEALIDWLHEAMTLEIDPDFVKSELLNYDWIESDNDWHIIDFTGDGNNEWLMTIYLENWRATWGRPGDFWIVGKNGLVYRFFQPEAYFCYSPCLPEPGDFYSDAPQIETVTDMTGDGLPDLVLVTTMGGATAITSQYYIISYHFGMAQNLDISPPHDRFVWGDIMALRYTEESSTIAMTYSQLLGVEDIMGNGVGDLLIRGGHISSFGAGIQRLRTEVWSWNGKTISLTEVRWDPTNYRMHILWEANDFYYRGNYPESRRLFHRVIYDETLKENPFFEEIQYESLSRFAAFRLFLIALQENNDHDVNYWQQWLDTHYPDSHLANGATLLREQSNNLQDLSSSCLIVTEYFKQFETVIDVADHTVPTGTLYRTMGHANPALKAEDVCLIVESRP